jgi:4-phytase/acid phosphatase
LIRLRCASLAVVVTAALLAPVLSAQATAASTKEGSKAERLRLVVILSRHGVRSPTWTQAKLNAYSALPWPAWSVAPGELTPHGFELLKDFGAFDGAELRAEGLFGAEGCADAALTTVYADTDQRTIASGKALAEGLFPGCAPVVASRTPGENDPLFHPGVDTLSAAQTDAVFAELQQRVAAMVPEVALFDEMQKVLLGCAATAKTCAPQNVPSMMLSTSAPGVVRGQGDHFADLQGPLPVASSLAEDLLLEYTDGMPMADVGWGHVDEAQLRRFLRLHTAYFDLMHRTPALARLGNAGLLQHIEETLEQAVAGKAVNGAVGKPGDKLVVLVGHDTNLAGVASLLGLQWTLDGRADDTPPGTELVFELWEDAAGTYRVRLKVQMQTLDQMRNGKTLRFGEAPPAQQDVSPTGCGTRGCSWVSFKRLAESGAGAK